MNKRIQTLAIAIGAIVSGLGLTAGLYLLQQQLGLGRKAAEVVTYEVNQGSLTLNYKDFQEAVLDVNVRYDDGTTQNFHEQYDSPIGTQTKVLTLEDKCVEWVQVHGTNYHYEHDCNGGQPTPSPEPEPTPTPTQPPATPSPQPTPSIVPTPTPTPVVTPSPTPIASPTPSPTPTPPVGGPDPSPTPSPSPSPTPTPSPTPSATPLPNPTPTPAVTPSPTPTPKPGVTPTPTPESNPDPTPTPGTEVGGFFGENPTPTPDTVETVSMPEAGNALPTVLVLSLGILLILGSALVVAL